MKRKPSEGTREKMLEVHGWRSKRKTSARGGCKKRERTEKIMSIRNCQEHNVEHKRRGRGEKGGGKWGSRQCLEETGPHHPVDRGIAAR